MLRMTVTEYGKYNASHAVYDGDKFLGSISVWGDHIAGEYHDICVCYVRDFSVAHTATLAGAVRWLSIKEAMHHA